MCPCSLGGSWGRPSWTWRQGWCWARHALRTCASVSDWRWAHGPSVRQRHRLLPTLISRRRYQSPRRCGRWVLGHWVCPGCRNWDWSLRRGRRAFGQPILTRWGKCRPPQRCRCRALASCCHLVRVYRTLCRRRCRAWRHKVNHRSEARLTEQRLNHRMCRTLTSALLAAFHTCSDESGSAGMSRVPELRVTWEQGVRLGVQGGYVLTASR